LLFAKILDAMRTVC